MLNKFDPTVNSIITFLKILGVKVNNYTVDETLQNHPDWPSMLCVSDSLTKWNIPNGAGKVEVADIDLLPTPFIAYTSSYENPLEVVAEVTEQNVVIISEKQKKPLIVNKEDFTKRWKGIYLIAEKNDKSGEKDFNINRRKSLIKTLIPVSSFLLLILISLLFLLQNLEFSSGSLSFFPVLIQYLILFAGILVTSLLLWYEIDNSNPILHKVCTGIVKGNCDAILNSNQSKVFSWLSWGEVGFFYFAGGFLGLLFVSPLIESLSVIGYLNIIALPYTIFSIYYQARVAKQWCMLCMSVQVLLLLGAINVLINGLLIPVLQIPIEIIFKSILFYLLPVSIWYVVKPYLMRLQTSKNTKREYMRVKFNTEIFDTLLKKQKQITLPTEGIGIDLGNPEATNTLIKVCNPYCGPCANAHSKIKKLLEEIPNLKVKIIFTTPNDPNHIAYKPVDHLLSIYNHTKSNEIIKQALDDWYLADKKDYDQFSAKHPVNVNLGKQGEMIESMYNCCNEMEINATPTIFINGSQLPDSYNIEDLEYFLLD